MSYQVLARKYRPQQFSDVIGQDHVTRTLKNAIDQGRIAHGYIFSGHRGIGKTTIARILAMALNCQSSDRAVPEPCGKCDSCMEIREGRGFDVIEIDAATNRGIDEVRRIRDEARTRPARDRYKIFILDEAHQITDAAFNAILKTLEEPPDWAVFMMATTQPEDIPQTIRSRCQHFSFHAVKFDDIVGQLKSIAQQEGIAADDDAIALLAEAGDGSMRDALSIMDQAIACSVGPLTADVVRGLAGAVASEILEEMMTAVERGASEEVLRLVDRLVTEGQSPVHFARQMVRFLRNAIVAKVAGGESPLLQISSDERARVTRVAALFSEEDLTRYLQILLRTYSELGYKQEQRFHLELGLLKLVHAARLLPLEQLLSGVTPSPLQGGANRAASGAGFRQSPAGSSPSVRPKGPSPFESDSTRKSPRSDGTSSPRVGFEPTPRIEGVGSSSPMASAAVAIPAMTPGVGTMIPQTSDPESDSGGPNSPHRADSAEALRDAVLGALENANQRSLPSMLELGGWRLNGAELLVQVTDSPTIVELTVTDSGQRMLNQFASAAAGRPIKVKVVGGSTAAASAPNPQRSSAGGASARARAAQDPVVQHMLEKFGAEIRTVVDQKK